MPYAVTRWERLFETMLDLSTQITVGPRSDLILERMLRSSFELLAPRMVHLLLEDPLGIRRYVLTRSEGGRELLTLQTVPKTKELSRWMRQEAVDAVSRREQIGWGLGGLTGDDRLFALVAPMNMRSSQAGVLLAFPDRRPFSAEDAKLLTLLANLVSVAIENAELYRQLREEASTDGLTGAYNYRYYMASLEREIKRAGRYGETFAVLMVDVDNLKEYNDLYGHLAGSTALRELGTILQSTARQTDLIAKYGGDEFSVILPNTDTDGALAFGHRLLSRVARQPFGGEPDRRLTVSVGIAAFPADGRDPRALLGQADRRLYQAKSAGKNRLCLHDGETLSSDAEIERTR